GLVDAVGAPLLGDALVPFVQRAVGLEPGELVRLEARGVGGRALDLPRLGGRRQVLGEAEAFRRGSGLRGGGGLDFGDRGSRRGRLGGVLRRRGVGVAVLAVEDAGLPTQSGQEYEDRAHRTQDV